LDPRVWKDPPVEKAFLDLLDPPDPILQALQAERGYLETLDLLDLREEREYLENQLEISTLYLNNFIYILFDFQGDRGLTGKPVSSISNIFLFFIFIIIYCDLGPTWG